MGPPRATPPASRARELVVYLAILAVGVITLVVVLPVGNRIDPAPGTAPLSAVGGPGADCLGPRLASVQSGTFLDLHRPGPPGAEAVESKVGERVGRGRIDRETGAAAVEGRCADGTRLAGTAYAAELVLRGAEGATATGTVVVDGERLDVDLAPTAASHAAEGEALTGSELTGRVFLAVAVVIVAARLLGSTFARIRQPKVMGEIVAGILLGPSLLGLVAPDVTAYLFPTEVVEVLRVMAQFGLIFFMFLIGMELDLRMARGSGRTAVGVAFASMAVPFALGVAASLVLYPMLASGRFAGFALFIGSAMAITAFPVLARILTDTGLYRTRLGVLAISAAAVGDLTAWCVMAASIAVVQAAGPGEALRTAVVSAAFVALCVVVVRPLVARLARVHEQRGRLNPPVMAGLLVGVLLAAWATEQIGIHAIFGAFLLGAVMPRSTGLIEEINSKLEDVTVLLLLPIFFAVVGLSTRFGLLDQLALWGVAAMVVALAVVGKLVGTLLAARGAGEGWRHSVGLGLLMNTRGLTEIVILTVGRSLGVISPALFTIMVIMALVTTFMATPLLAIVYPRKLVERDARRAASTGPVGPPGGHRVVVGVGSPASAEPVLDVVGRLRGPKGERPTVVLAQVVPPPGREEVRASLSAVEAAEAAARQELVPLAAELLRQGVDTVVRTRASNDPGAELVRLAEAEQASLLVAGWHRPYLGGNQLGGVVGAVLAGARCDVAVLLDRPRRGDDDAVSQPATGTGPVAVWYGGGYHDSVALDLAMRLVGSNGSSLRVLHPAAVEVPKLAVEHEDVRIATGDPRAVQAGLRGSSLVVLGRDERADGATRPRDAVLDDATAPVLLVQRAVTPSSS